MCSNVCIVIIILVYIIIIYVYDYEVGQGIVGLCVKVCVTDSHTMFQFIEQD